MVSIGGTGRGRTNAMEIAQNKCSLNTLPHTVVKICIKISKMTKSEKTSKTRFTFYLGMEPQITTLLPTCFEIVTMHPCFICSFPV